MKCLLKIFVAMFFSMIIYFLLGVNIQGCPRFYSIPFGGCSYSDKIIIINLLFWFIMIMILTEVLLKNKKKTSQWK